MRTALAFVCLGLTLACSDEEGGGAGDPDDAGAASGGSASTGGASAGTGGASAGTGGASAGTGGAGAGAGGTSSSGGRSGAGGNASAGGTPGGSGGSAAATGGSTGAGGSSSPDAGPANVDCTLVWQSGFENGFPGEWQNYDNGSWSASGTMPGGRVSAWTIVDRASGEPVLEGDHAYKGWITAAATDSHRAYPGIGDPPYRTPLVNTFWVYLDVDYARLGGDWVHFGTWGNAVGSAGQWALHTMSVRERKLEFAHTEPFLGEYIGPMPAPDFPLGRWVRFTVYVLYEGTTGFVQAWQDGVPMLRADVSQLASFPGDSLITAHWGMYAAAGVDHGVQYNDAIRIWTLDAELADLVTEPRCAP